MITFCGVTFVDILLLIASASTGVFAGLQINKIRKKRREDKLPDDSHCLECGKEHCECSCGNHDEGDRGFD